MQQLRTIANFWIADQLSITPSLPAQGSHPLKNSPTFSRAFPSSTSLHPHRRYWAWLLLLKHFDDVGVPCRRNVKVFREQVDGQSIASLQANFHRKWCSMQTLRNVLQQA
jgi:hypothetical protein